MQIRLTVVDPLGTPHEGRPASCDVLVTAPAGTALAAVASGLASAVGGEGAGVLYAGTERLDAQRCTLGEPPLTDGAVLSLGSPAEPGPDVDPAAAQLRVVAGPDAGGVHLLHGGRIDIGRSAEADVPLDDPDVSRLHCAVTVAADGRVSVADLGSTNGTTLDGRRVGERPVRFAPGALLRVGESALRLAPAGEPAVVRETAPDGEGHVRVVAAPEGALRGQPAVAAGLAPGRTGQPVAAAPGGAAAARVPHARDGGERGGEGGNGGGASDESRPQVSPLTAETHHGYGTAGWGAAEGGAPGAQGHGPEGPHPERPHSKEPPKGPHVVPGQGRAPRIERTDSGAASEESPGASGSGDGKRKGTPLRGTTAPRDVRRRGGLSAWARRRLAGGRSDEPYTGYDGYDEDAGYGKEDAPSAEPLPGGPPEPERWPDPAALLLAALGPGPRLWERGPGHPETLTVRLGTADRSAPDGSGLLPAVPVTSGLREVGALGLAGPRGRLSGLARAVVAQLAALHSPDALEITLISTDRSRSLEERTAEWSWLGWLPHLRPTHGQDCRLLLAYDREQATARTEELVRRLEDHVAETGRGSGSAGPSGGWGGHGVRLGGGSADDGGAFSAPRRSADGASPAARRAVESGSGAGRGAVAERGYGESDSDSRRPGPPVGGAHPGHLASGDRSGAERGDSTGRGASDRGASDRTGPSSADGTQPGHPSSGARPGTERGDSTGRRASDRGASDRTGPSSADGTQPKYPSSGRPPGASGPGPGTERGYDESTSRRPGPTVGGARQGRPAGEFRPGDGTRDGAGDRIGSSSAAAAGPGHLSGDGTAAPRAGTYTGEGTAPDDPDRPGDRGDLGRPGDPGRHGTGAPARTSSGPDRLGNADSGTYDGGATGPGGRDGAGSGTADRPSGVYAAGGDSGATHLGLPSGTLLGEAGGRGRAHRPSWARSDDPAETEWPGPHTVVVVDGDPGSAGVREAVSRLAAEGPQVGIHVICLAETPAASPSSPVTDTYEAACAVSPAFRECGAVALLSGDVATALRLLRVAPGGPAARTSGTSGTSAGHGGSVGGPVGHGTVAAVDAVSMAWAERFARALAPLRADGVAGERHARVSAPLPQAARLLDELGLARATPASLMARWADAADDTEALGGRAAAVLGAGPRGPVCVDLSDEGPHLLIEGPSGSGRTELLRSVAASLAAAERPDRLGIVLVDGRDGTGTGGAAARGDGLQVCTDLPHVTTYLTANDPVRMREFAQSLAAELKRRAELLGRLDFAEWHTRQTGQKASGRASGRVVAQRSANGSGGSGGSATRHSGAVSSSASGAADLDAPPSSTLRLRPAATRARPEAGPPLPRLVVVVDDLDALLSPALGSPGRPAAGSVVRALEAVARDGERLGVHLVAATGGGARTDETELARRATLRVVLEAHAPGPEEPAPGRGQLTGPAGRSTPFQGGRVTGRIPRTATLRPTVVPLEWARMGDPPARRPVRELGNGPTDLALLASALERAARSVSAAEVPSLL
jgi:pSer/pThr/pTyr-binding forkhead associated (FHA) protein